MGYRVRQYPTGSVSLLTAIKKGLGEREESGSLLEETPYATEAGWELHRVLRPCLKVQDGISTTQDGSLAYAYTCKHIDVHTRAHTHT